LKNKQATEEYRRLLHIAYNKIPIMEAYKFCQSCGMPLDTVAVFGTEKDSSKNGKYCKYCYQGGEFIKPDMTFNEMKDIVRAKLQEMHASENIIIRALEGLPLLERWTRSAEPQDRRN
jgi:hypothetical protein